MARPGTERSARWSLPRVLVDEQGAAASGQTSDEMVIISETGMREFGEGESVIEKRQGNMRAGCFRGRSRTALSQRDMPSSHGKARAKLANGGGCFVKFSTGACIVSFWLHTESTDPGLGKSLFHFSQKFQPFNFLKKKPEPCGMHAHAAPGRSLLY